MRRGCANNTQLDYIQPPPLTAKEILKTVENLDTLLSIRMNLQEYDKIPWQFRDYTIKDGRVTFRVAGEFEVDLGIVDEDPESQFWFVDLRFLFSPSIFELPVGARLFTEARVNAVLLKDGLLGCYNYLHEMLLTHKITEFRRQAIELAGGKWIDGLKVEPLNRSLSIQYWFDRYGKDGPKSWIILGVHSGRRKDGRPDPKATSRLSIRWFRNGKEVKDLDVPFDAVNISALSLLKTVIALHVNFILTSIYDKMQNNPIFAKHQAHLSLSTSKDEPAESTLTVQLTNKEHLAVSIEPVTGRFIFSPASPIIGRIEFMLNSKSRDPASDAHTYIENMRAMVILDDFTTHSVSAGWVRDIGPKVATEVLKKLVGSFHQIAWFRRASWLPNWFAVLTVGNEEERWFLLEAYEPPSLSGLFLEANYYSINNPSGSIISQSFEMRITGVSPTPTYAFFSRLNIYAAALICHFVNLRTLHSRHARHTLQPINPTSPVKLPCILMRLSELLPSKNKSPRTQKPWAKDSVKLTFQGLEFGSPEELVPTVHSLEAASASLAKAKAKSKIPANLPLPNATTVASPVLVQPVVVQSPAVQPPVADGPKQLGPGESVVVVTEARMSVPVPQALAILKARVDRDIAFDPRSGTFAFRLRSKVGESVIPAFVERAIRVERLVDFVEVLHKHDKILKCKYISLGRIIFTYGNAISADGMDVGGDAKGYKAIIDFGSTDTVMTLEFEKGNPHIRIADFLTKVLNEKQGLDGVATLLPLTLPALRAFDTLEGSWTPLGGNEKVNVCVRAVEWYTIKYNIPSSDPAKPRKIMLDIRLQQRKGEPWWYVRRTDIRDREGDDVDAALKPVWNMMGLGWQGMRVNAVAQPAGMEELIGKLDEVMRNLALGSTLSAEPAPAPTPAAAPVPAPVKPPQRAPEAPMMQPQRQLPTPNQSQSQSQGRNTPQSQGRNTPNQSQGQSQGRGNPIKREIVEID